MEKVNLSKLISDQENMASASNIRSLKVEYRDLEVNTKRPKEPAKILKIISIFLHRNHRCHAVFSDGSAIIIHTKGDWFTYFPEDGTKEADIKARHFIAFPPIKDNIKNKVIATVAYYNKYWERPIVLLEEVFDDVKTKEVEIKKFYWKNDTKTSHKSGTISLNSLNNQCKIKLNSNKFIFWAEFLQKLPTKKLDWVYNDDK